VRGAGRVQGIRVDPDGKEVGRATLDDLFERAGQLQGLMDLDGGFHLLWKELQDGHTKVYLAPVDPEAIAVTGKPREVFNTPRRVLRLTAPPVVPMHEALSCLIQDDPAKPHELALQRFHYLGAGSPPSPEPFLLPEDRPISMMDGRLDADTTFHLLLLTEDHEVLYFNDLRGKVSPVAQLEEADLPTPLSLVVTPDCDVYAVYRRADQGLREDLIRTRDADEDGEF